MKQRLNPQEVCNLLGVTTHALHKWRSPRRLIKGREDPLFLPAKPDPKDPRVVWYDYEDVKAFCMRNERYLDKYLAGFAPDAALFLLTPSQKAA